MSLWADFQTNTDGRLIHKWKHYFLAYERHLARFVGRSVTVIEIGVGEGGSLHMWKRFFGPHAQIVGLDIVPRCKAFEEDQIAVRIGSQNDPVFLDSIVDEFGAPDIVIDDGSHHMQHVAASFAHLYSRLSKNGVYLVEDLHTAYWPEYGGGLRAADSFIEIAKGLIDELNADFTRDQLEPTDFTRTTHAISFYDSIVVFDRGTYTNKSAPRIGKPAPDVDNPLLFARNGESTNATQLQLELKTVRAEYVAVRAELERERAVSQSTREELDRERAGAGLAREAIAAAEVELQRLNAEIRKAGEREQQREDVIGGLHKQAVNLEQSRAALTVKLSTLAARLTTATERVQAMEGRTRDTQKELATTEAALRAVVGSHSWRYTEPMRIAAQRAQTLRAKVGKLKLPGA